MAEDITTVGPGKTATTITAAEAATSSNPSNDQAWECTGDCQPTSAGEARINYPNSSVVTTIVRPAAGDGLKDNLGGSRVVSTDYNAGAYIGSGGGRPIRVDTGHPFTMQDMELDGIGTGGELVELMNGADVVLIERCFFHESTGTAGKVGIKTEAGAKGLLVRECYFTLLLRGIIQTSTDAAADTRVINCTAFNNTNGYQQSGGAGSKIMLLNVFALGNGTDFTALTTPGTGSDWWGSSDTTASTVTNNFQSLTASNVLESTTGTIDLHLLASVDGDYDGNDVDAELSSTDFDDDTRIDYDMGADEIVAAGGDIVVLRRRRSA